MFQLLKFDCIYLSHSELDVRIRVTETDSSSASNMEGLAEVRYNNTWGTICGDHWRDKETDVFCKSKNDEWRYFEFFFYAVCCRFFVCFLLNICVFLPLP